MLSSHPSHHTPLTQTQTQKKTTRHPPHRTSQPPSLYPLPPGDSVSITHHSFLGPTHATPLEATLVKHGIHIIGHGLHHFYHCRLLALERVLSWLRHLQQIEVLATEDAPLESSIHIVFLATSDSPTADCSPRSPNVDSPDSPTCVITLRLTVRTIVLGLLARVYPFVPYSGCLVRPRLFGSDHASSLAIPSTSHPLRPHRA